jgi:hypothetical protein
MRAICHKAEDPLIEGAIYTVEAVTRKGNYILSELNPPTGFNCFDKNRFQILEIWPHEDEFIEEYDFSEEEAEILFS